MTGRTHALVAALLYAPLVFRLSGSVEVAALGAVVAASAALAPDFDHQGSTAARSLGPLSGFGAFVVNRRLGHRGGMHSFAVCVLLAALVAYALALSPLPRPLVVLLAFGVNLGYLSHLLLDWLTPAGVPLLWPLTARRFSSWPLTFHSAGPINGVLIAGAVAWAIFWLLGFDSV